MSSFFYLADFWPSNFKETQYNLKRSSYQTLAHRLNLNLRFIEIFSASYALLNIFNSFLLFHNVVFNSIHHVAKSYLILLLISSKHFRMARHAQQSANCQCWREFWRTSTLHESLELQVMKKNLQFMVQHQFVFVFVIYKFVHYEICKT